MTHLPAGTITWLFTDIEGSTTRWERDQNVMRTAVDRHLSLLGSTMDAHGGVLFKIVGGAIQATFPRFPKRWLP